MEKFVLVLLVLSININFSFAQSLDINALPEIDDTRIIKNVSQLDSFDVGPFGLGVEWDFSQLSFDSISEFSYSYLDSEAVDVEENFPDATIAYVNQNNPTMRDYYVSSGNWFISLGGSFGNDGHVRVNPGVKHFLFPMEYQNSVISEGQTIFFLTTDTVTNYHRIERTFDGFGTLKTDAGEFENCVRIKESYKSSAIPNFDNAIETIRHLWYYGKISNEMAAVAEVVGANTYSYRWQENINSLVSSNDNIPEQEVSISYLKNGDFNINAPRGNYYGDLYSIDGKKITTKQFSIDHESQTVQMSFDAQLPSGTICLLLLWEKESGTYKAQKISW